jgi:16S rRNA (cytosine1402-N4)-methyltransferase
MEIKHYSVLKNEVIDKMDIKPDGIYVDATLGLGGHSEEIAKRLTTGKLICFDQDEKAMASAKERLGEYKDRIHFVESNFANLKEELSKLGISKIDGILYDLGTSYYQLTDESRGFTYHGETELDMRMDLSKEFSAYDVVNEYSEEELSRVFREFGDEKQHRRLASAIVEAREIKPIKLNTELNEIIKSVKG